MIEGETHTCRRIRITLRLQELVRIQHQPVGNRVAFATSMRTVKAPVRTITLHRVAITHFRTTEGGFEAREAGVRVQTTHDDLGLRGRRAGRRARSHLFRRSGGGGNALIVILILVIGASSSSLETPLGLLDGRGLLTR